MTSEDIEALVRRAQTLDRDVGAEVARAALISLRPDDPCLSPTAATRVARLRANWGEHDLALQFALAAARRTDDIIVWHAAAEVLDRLPRPLVGCGRSVTLGVAGSSTTATFTPIIRLAAALRGVDCSVVDAGYGQYQQALLDVSSPLAADEVDSILLLVDHRDARFDDSSPDPVETEAARWAALWEAPVAQTKRAILQLGFVTPPERPLGHLTPRTSAATQTRVDVLNRRLATMAPDHVAFIDADHLASCYGKDKWFDARAWNMAKQAIAPAALPLVARHVAAVLVARLGMSRKCAVLDLDNTLWGGIVGEDGPDGVRCGHEGDGQAFEAFQSYLLALRQRGVLLAVVTKNNDADAREPFERAARMPLGLDDFAVFLASWDDKPSQVRRVSEALGIGEDALVFIDDNPVERAAVSRFCPEVAVLELPEDPSGYVRALDTSLLFEPAAITEDDVARTAQYRARDAARQSSDAAGNLEDFLVDLDMHATAGRVGPANLSRVEQLLGKTNQFNLTTRRHSASDVAALLESGGAGFTFRLSDRFGDHGLVGVALVIPTDAGTAEIDTLLMSCRVLGRTLELTMLSEVVSWAREAGYTRLIGRYRSTPKNVQVADLYPRVGFSPVHVGPNEGVWSLDLTNVEIAPGIMALDQVG